MTKETLLAPRVVGLVVLLGFVLPAIGFTIVARRGLIGGIEAAFRGVAGRGDTTRALTIVTGYWIPGTILLISGLGLLAVLLRSRGDPGISTIAFTLVTLGLTLAILEGTFQASVTPWAGRVWERQTPCPSSTNSSGSGSTSGSSESGCRWSSSARSAIASSVSATTSYHAGPDGPGILCSLVVLIQMITAGTVIVALAFILHS